jgi:prepilin-type processing-associated H-X9-DG protein
MANNNPDAWWDVPAYYHNDRSTLGFADGHAEKRTWRDPRTIRLMKGEPDPTTGLMESVIQLNNADLQWMIRGFLPSND